MLVTGSEREKYTRGEAPRGPETKAGIGEPTVGVSIRGFSFVQVHSGVSVKIRGWIWMRRCNTSSAVSVIVNFYKKMSNPRHCRNDLSRLDQQPLWANTKRSSPRITFQPHRRSNSQSVHSGGGPGSGHKCTWAAVSGGVRKKKMPRHASSNRTLPTIITRALLA